MASGYYQYLPGGDSLASRAAARARRRMFDIFMEAMNPSKEAAMLDVGVTSSTAGYGLENYFETLYPYKERITAAGLEDAGHLEAWYPGVRFMKIAAGPLPFGDRSFDYVHSSAVIEHVGSRDNQIGFLRELWRVSRRGIFLTTPNRWFPIEVHTVLPFLHWLPPEWFRAALRALGKDYFAREENLNLLSSATFLSAAAEAGIPGPRIRTVGMFGWPTNLLLIAVRPPITG